MASKKVTRRALIGSMLSLLLCCSMLIGTTFAWFTDTVTSTGNIIKSGTLDVEMSWSDTRDGTYKDASAGAIFDYQYWEPGYTEVRYVNVKNVGDLAFKFQLNIIPDVKPVAGEVNLADVIDVHVADVTNASGFDDRAAAMAGTQKVGVLSALMSDPNGAARGTMLPAAGKASDKVVAPADAITGEITYCIVLHMQESAGNEYQNLSVGEGFAVQLLATQMTYEKDSFGNDYDTNAVWPGEIDTNWYTADPTAEEFTISTAEELAGLAALVNGTNVAPDRVVTYALANEGEASAEETVPVQESFAGVTVKLGGNIDLKNMNWAPIGYFVDDKNSTNDAPFKGVFDGQGYTIKNLYINAPELNCVGLFGYAENSVFKNVTVENAKIAGYSQVATIVGRPYKGCTISNCHVTGNIDLTAEFAYVGGIAGYGYLDVDNCSVIADGMGKLTAKEKNAVGGITAWLLENGSSMTNCRAENLTLVGYSNIGGLTGFLHYDGVIDSCHAENINMIKTRKDGHPGIGWASGGWNYNADKPAVIKNSTFKNISRDGTAVYVASAGEMYGSEYYGNTLVSVVCENNTVENCRDNLVWVTAAKTADALTTAIAAGGNVVLSGDLVVKQKITVPTGTEVVLDLGGNTLSGAFDNQGGSALIENNGTLTVKNGTIVSLAEYPDVDWGTEGFPAYATNTISNRGTLIIEDGAVIENQTNVGGASYAIDNYSGGQLTVNGGTIIAKDCAIRQFTNSVSAANSVTINGGSITGKRAVWVQLPSSDSTQAMKANLTVTGGTLKSNVADGTGNVIYSYSYGNSFANTNVTISGGQFLNGQVAFGGGYKGDKENVQITGGVFEQDVIRYLDGDVSQVLYSANA